MDEQQVDCTKLKYALYARKSTTDELRQVRSIPDQITDCLILARDLGITISPANIIKEEKSAKKPNLRPKFNQLLKDLKAGKYDGILAWNPDRLARNILEGGMIIDMVDTGIIKDLKFKTHHFTKDANGKMLLGMAFVLSKQYSDDLSQKVTRGVRKKFQEGKTQIPKHGYINTDGMYKPDGKNFEIICQAWKKRSQDISIEDIAKWMDKEGYGRRIKKNGKVVKMSFKILSDVFHDPFYYGILIQANQTIDLREIPDYGFVPAITEELYNQVQALSKRHLKPFNTKRRIIYYPFRALLVCGFCEHNMVVAPSTSQHGQKSRYLYARCDYEVCKEEKRRIDKKTGKDKRNIRVKIILDYLYELLKNGLNMTDQEYRDYYQEMTIISDENVRKARIQLHSRRALLGDISGQIKEISLGITKLEKESRAWKENQNKLMELEDQEEETQKEIKELEIQMSDPEKDKLTIEDFLNLVKNAAEIVQLGDAVAKDAICRLIFLNLTIGVDEVLSYQAKPLFEQLLKRGQNPSSRGERT